MGATMKIQRNEPCPCGSGKKYKKCCEAKDREASRERAREQQAADAAHAPHEHDHELSPQERAQAELHRRFEAADFDERLAIFERALDDHETTDDEMVFEMMTVLYDQAA